MQKIGLVGGLGPASTVEYYRELIALCREIYGPDCYPEILIDSLNMGIHNDLLDREAYDELAERLLKSLRNLQAGGAEVAAITANTEHILWDKLKDRLPLPAVSIVDAALDEIKEKDYCRILVFGTSWTMNSGLYDRAITKAGRTAILPTPADRAVIGALICPNLENGVVIPEDKAKMLALIEQYIQKERADALLLGCTELPLMIQPGDVSVPVIDTTRVHIARIFRAVQGEGKP